MAPENVRLRIPSQIPTKTRPSFVSLVPESHVGALNPSYTSPEYTAVAVVRTYGPPMARGRRRRRCCRVAARRLRLAHHRRAREENCKGQTTQPHSNVRRARRNDAAPAGFAPASWATGARPRDPRSRCPAFDDSGDLTDKRRSRPL